MTGKKTKPLATKVVMALIMLGMLPLLVLLNISGSNSMFPVAADLEMTAAPVTQKSPRRFALLTEPRCLNATPFVLMNALEMLPEDINVVLNHGQGNMECVQQWIQETPVLFQANSTGRLVHRIDSHMDVGKNYRIPHHYGTHWYSVMFTNISFWQSLRLYGDNVLVIQSDTLICSNRTPPWNAHYIGGISYGNPMAKWAVNETNTHHLNGGLSIRSLDWMIDCLANYTGNKLAEDAVFNNCDYGNVTIGDAMEFASDNGRTMCFDWNGKRLCPWGVHKPWALAVGRGPPIRELVAYCPDIQRLADLLEAGGSQRNLSGKFCWGARCV